MKKILKRTGKIFCLFLLIVVLVNILSPLFCRKPDETYVESLRKTEFTSETAGVERICCIDDNEEALLWRLRMIGTAKESIVLSTFDLRADDNGTKILAALNCAAARGVKIQLLIDGIYQQLFLAGSSDFQALASYENVEVGVYNPVTPVNLFKVNYRMHDKYLIVDEKMYLLGGRNSNDIFLGNQTKGINEDRDILVYDTSEGQGESLNQLEDYFHKIWKESRILYRTIPVCLDLTFTIDRRSQSVYDPSDKSVTYRHTCLLLGSCYLCSFFDSCIFTEQDTSDAVCTDILNHTFQTILKGYNLAIHSMINTMYRGDTISDGDDCSYFLVLADFVIILNFFFQNRNDFIWIHCSQLLFTSVSISVLNCYNVRGDSSRTLCLRQKE